MEVPAHTKIVVLDLEHQEGTLAYEEPLKVPLQLASFEKTEPVKN